MSFAQLLTTFADNLLPILLISAGGFLIGRFLKVEARTVGRIVFYLFSPVLVFNLLMNNQLPLNDILQVSAMATGVVFITGLIALIGGLVMQLKRPTLMAVLITTMFANNGNYGLPLILFAFGKDTLAHSSVYFVVTSLWFNTVGVLIASLGHMDFKQALLGLLKVPTIYAVILALLFTNLHISMPTPIDRTISLVASGSIPLMLVLLGLELQRAQWTKNISALTLSTGIRLLIGPLIGFVLGGMMGMSASAKQGSIIEASMPSAVSNTVLASEYNLDTSLVTATILISTLLSPLTLTPLLVFLK